MRLFDGRWRTQQASLKEPQGERELDRSARSPRYARNPQLAVIEDYALDVIGELSPEELEETELTVRDLYGDARDWRRAVRRRFGWDPLMDVSIAERWHEFRRVARERRREPQPGEFARGFADEVVRLSWS